MTIHRKLRDKIRDKAQENFGKIQRQAQEKIQGVSYSADWVYWDAGTCGIQLDGDDATPIFPDVGVFTRKVEPSKLRVTTDDACRVLDLSKLQIAHFNSKYGLLN